jgi:hypothetical protein
MNHWPKIDLWHLAPMKGGFDELCDLLSCTQVATVVAVISDSNGGSSIRRYCATHEHKGFEKLKRNHPRAEPIDHRRPTPIGSAKAR